MTGGTQTQPRLEFLDFARGVAALMVVLAHGLSVSVPGFLHWSIFHFDPGRAGVVLFLLISGFIIPASLEKGGHLGKFWLRRFFRLFPAYWVSLAAAYAYLALGGGHPLEIRLDDVTSWLANLTMCQGFLGRPDAWGVYWTLRLELVVYAACSLLFVGGLLRRVRWGLGVAVVLAFLLTSLVRPVFMAKPFALSDRLLYFVPLVGLIAHRYWSGHLSRARFYFFLALQPAALVAIWAANKAIDPDGLADQNLRTVLLNWGSAYGLFFVLLESGRWRLPPVGLWLGRVSYSIYLFHPLVLWLLLAWHCPPAVLVPALLAGTLLLAATAYHGVEAPGIALGRRVEAWLFNLYSATSASAPASASTSCSVLNGPGLTRTAPSGNVPWARCT